MEKENWFDVYDGAILMKSTRDEAEAKRKVFAENCSYLHAKDQTWSYKPRAKKLEDA